MRAIIQRVSQASVTVGGEQVSSIGRGLCVLLGISVDDTERDAEYIVRKILNLRVFEDGAGRAWSGSVMERELEVLCVSQFTLQCVLKGNRPDFHLAMPAERAQPFYHEVLERMRSSYRPELVKDPEAGKAAAEEAENQAQRPPPAPKGPQQPPPDPKGRVDRGGGGRRRYRGSCWGPVPCLRPLSETLTLS
ncbi:D-aminoacyl-tRNA deacylase 1 isoform 2-T3 [Menidia menidia]